MIKVAAGWLRVEYGGNESMPTRVVVPLTIPKGKYHNIQLLVEPRAGVKFKQSVETGDALQQTFTTSRSGNAGASFFGSASYGRTTSTASLSYQVSMTPDFTGVVFSLQELTADQAMGIQIAFPIESYTPSPLSPFFARVIVTVEGKESDRQEVPQEIHPQAARALVINGLADPALSAQGMPRGPFLTFAGDVVPSSFDELHDAFLGDWDVVHVLCSVGTSTLRFGSFVVPAETLFRLITRCGAKLVFLSCCNSVSVVSSFRESGASALIAATETLYVKYAHAFESTFYNGLASGTSVGESFHSAITKTDEYEYSGRRSIQSTSNYSPMFLDMKRDFSFRPPGR